jgi:voltage-gated potassium channel Kch
MLLQVLIGSVLMIITTFIHAGGMALGLRGLAIVYTDRSGMPSILIRALVVGAFVVVMFVTTLVEASAWAITYSMLYAVSDFEKALYFSTVTYTTLGYGDVVLDAQWRLLSSFQAANGIIMFGWTTALIVVVIYRVSRSLRHFESPR